MKKNHLNHGKLQNYWVGDKNMKYRILQLDSSFYPQHKGWFFWYCFGRRATITELLNHDFYVGDSEECRHSVSYSSQEEAERFIRNKIEESKLPKYKEIRKIITLNYEK